MDELYFTVIDPDKGSYSTAKLSRDTDMTSFLDACGGKPVFTSGDYLFVCPITLGPDHRVFAGRECITSSDGSAPAGVAMAAFVAHRNVCPGRPGVESARMLQYLQAGTQSMPAASQAHAEIIYDAMGHDEDEPWSTLDSGDKSRFQRIALQVSPDIEADSSPQVLAAAIGQAWSIDPEGEDAQEWLQKGGFAGLSQPMKTIWMEIATIVSNSVHATRIRAQSIRM